MLNEVYVFEKVPIDGHSLVDIIISIFIKWGYMKYHLTLMYYQCIHAECHSARMLRGGFCVDLDGKKDLTIPLSTNQTFKIHSKLPENRPLISPRDTQWLLVPLPPPWNLFFFWIRIWCRPCCFYVYSRPLYGNMYFAKHTVNIPLIILMTVVQ